MKAIQQSSAKKFSSSLQKISSDSPVSGKVVYPGKLQSGEFFDREIAVRRVSESINRINDISSERDATNKTRHPIILASAMSCIGKNTFGETVVREIAQMEPFGSEFGVALSEMNYLTVNVKGEAGTVLQPRISPYHLISALLLGSQVKSAAFLRVLQVCGVCYEILINRCSMHMLN